MVAIESFGRSPLAMDRPEHWIFRRKTECWILPVLPASWGAEASSRSEKLMRIRLTAAMRDR